LCEQTTSQLIAIATLSDTGFIILASISCQDHYLKTGLTLLCPYWIKVLDNAVACSLLIYRW
jgi:hypothetical protein